MRGNSIRVQMEQSPTCVEELWKIHMGVHMGVKMRWGANGVMIRRERPDLDLDPT